MTTAPTPTARLLARVADWPGVTLRRDDTAVVVVEVGEATVGRLHPHGRLDVLVAAPFRQPLVHDGLATDAGAEADWVERSVQTAEDVVPATRLLRLAYLYRRILRSPHAEALDRIRAELDRRVMGDALRAAFEAVLEHRARTFGPSHPPSARSPSP